MLWFDHEAVKGKDNGIEIEIVLGLGWPLGTLGFGLGLDLVLSALW